MHESLTKLQQAAQHDNGHRDVRFNMSNLVLRRTNPFSDAAQGFAASLSNKWRGSYSVSVGASPLSYTLVYCKTRDEYGSSHVNNLKRFFDRSEDLDILQIPVIADPGSRPVTLSPVHRYNLRSRR